MKLGEMRAEDAAEETEKQLRYDARLTLRSGVLGYSDQHLSNAGGYGTQPTRVLDIRRCLF